MFVMELHFGWLLLLAMLVMSLASEPIHTERFSAHCGRGYRLDSNPTWEYSVRSSLDCLRTCLSQQKCVAVNVIKQGTARKRCEMFESLSGSCVEDSNAKHLALKVDLFSSCSICLIQTVAFSQHFVL